MPVMCSTVGLPTEKGMDDGVASADSVAILTWYACDMVVFQLGAKRA